MKSFNKIILAVIFMLTAVAGYAQSEQELRDQIEKMNNQMAEQMVAGDYMAGIEHYTDDAVSLPNWNPMIKGKDAMRKANEEMMKRGMKIKDFKFETVEIMQCGNMVIEIGKYKMSMETPQMSETMNDHGKYMTVWEKQRDGSLKIKADIWNTSQSPMALMGNMPREKQMHDKEGMHQEERMYKEEGMHQEEGIREKKWDEKEKVKEKKTWEEKKR